MIDLGVSNHLMKVPMGLRKLVNFLGVRKSTG